MAGTKYKCNTCSWTISCITIVMTLSLLTWNVRGILHGADYVHHTLSQPVDVIALQEHWLPYDKVHHLNSFKDMKLVTYNCKYPKSNCSRGSDGLSILLNNKSLWKAQCVPVQSDYAIAVKLTQQHYCDVFVIACRLPSTNVLHSTYCNALNELMDVYDYLSVKGTTLIMGDLNSDICKRALSPRDKLLHSAISDRNLVHSLSVLPSNSSGYTCRSKNNMFLSMIDYILVPSCVTEHVTECTIIDTCPFSVSDHSPCYLSLTLTPAENGNHNVDYGISKWNKASEDDISFYQCIIEGYLNSYSLFHVNPNQQHNIDAYNDLITASLMHAGSRCIPHSKYRPYLKPFWKSNGLNDAHYYMRAARREWVSNGRPREDNSVLRSAYKDRKREFRRLYRISKRCNKKQMLKEIETSAELDVNSFYKTVRKQRARITNVPELHYDGENGSTPLDICRLWGKYYSDLAQPHSSEHFDNEFKDYISSFVDNIEQNVHSHDEDLEKQFTFPEVKEAVKSLSKNKSPGPDKITNEHMLYAGDTLITHLCVLFNKIVSHHYVPKEYRLGMVIPIYKGKNDKRDPRNYRGITLTSCLGKLFEKLLLKRIEIKLSKSQPDFPDLLQFGFRKEHGAIMSVLTLMESIQYYLQRDSPVFASFLDNEKAFDRIWHDGLFYKLYQLGVTGNTWKLLHHCYTNNYAFVSYQGEKSDSYIVRQGVGQGRVISSWFFLVFINDLITALREANCGIRVCGMDVPAVLLADDTALQQKVYNYR